MKVLVKKLLRKVRSYFPSPLPVGMSEFQAWSDDIIDLAGAPNNDSIRFALSTMILHSDAQAANKSKHYFVLCLRKGMANEVASGVMHELKAKQKAEAEKKVTEVASNVVA